ncbi:C40 family peptidase [Micromonospora siamensis]|uniref:Cell wall-associated hydrolase, NlpC family n=1 Tax=Micromonospora siamensis TaxID=299152 RepID=A0A1C5JXR9_9ACTN|nr:C40 family peptidase [Micromonospora siamensis]SCG75360.1 Cell wall-associated hydrolase, NlpC family [Micromonospora siamensis]
MSSLRILLRSLAVTGLAAVLIAPASAVRAEPTPAELTAQIEKSSLQLERVVEAYNGLTEKMKANQATAATLKTQLGPLETQAEQSRADVAEMAVTAYKTGGLRDVEALLAPGGSGALADRLSTMDRLTRQRQDRIAGYTANQRRLLAQKAQLDTTVARQAAQGRELAATRKRIETDLARLYELRRQAYGRATEAAEAARAAEARQAAADRDTRSTSTSKSTSKSTSTSTASAPPVSGAAGTAVRYAYGALGKPYVWGADGPEGYDCSGLTLAAWRAAGKSLPHNAAMQWDKVSHISRGELRPGDLVFYYDLGHVAIYVGDGQVIDAPSAGRNVRKRSVDMASPYGYGRVR